MRTYLLYVGYGKGISVNAFWQLCTCARTSVFILVSHCLTGTLPPSPHLVLSSCGGGSDPHSESIDHSVVMRTTGGQPFSQRCAHSLWGLRFPTTLSALVLLDGNKRHKETGILNTLVDGALNVAMLRRMLCIDALLSILIYSSTYQQSEPRGY